MSNPAEAESPPEQEADTPRLAEVRQKMGAQQEELPFAIVNGEAITTLPKDLYIPPAALEVFLTTFEGPLDLLLYLIKRQILNSHLNINILRFTPSTIFRVVSFIHLFVIQIIGPQIKIV